MQTEKSQWHAQCKPKRRIQRTPTTEAHQPKRKEDERYEFQEIRHKTITVEHCKNINEGMSGDHDEAHNMTVYVKTFNRKTSSVRCGRRQETNKIKEEVARKTKIPQEQQCLVSRKSTDRRDDNRRTQHPRSHDKRNDFETAGWNEE